MKRLRRSSQVKLAVVMLFCGLQLSTGSCGSVPHSEPIVAEVNTNLIDGGGGVDTTNWREVKLDRIIFSLPATMEKQDVTWHDTELFAFKDSERELTIEFGIMIHEPTAQFGPINSTSTGTADNRAYSLVQYGIAKRSGIQRTEEVLAYFPQPLATDGNLLFELGCYENVECVTVLKSILQTVRFREEKKE